jgi:hypothetical protein
MEWTIDLKGGKGGGKGRRWRLAAMNGMEWMENVGGRSAAKTLTKKKQKKMCCDKIGLAAIYSFANGLKKYKIEA